MRLDYDAQRAYCARLGLIPDSGAHEAWWTDPMSRRVSGLLARMETEKGKIDSAARWIRDSLDRTDRRFEGDEIHTAGMSSSGEAARYALEYDMAVTRYTLLEDELRALVNEIREAAGYARDAFGRLEDHPALPAADDQAVRALRVLDEHLAGFRTMGVTAQRRHLREDHGVTARRGDGPSPALLHDSQHADARAAAVAAAEGIDASLATGR
jgi:hypothetical protein